MYVFMMSPLRSVKYQCDSVQSLYFLPVSEWHRWRSILYSDTLRKSSSLLVLKWNDMK